MRLLLALALTSSPLSASVAASFPAKAAAAWVGGQLTALPPITVPAITIDGSGDGVNSGTAHHAKRFTGPHEHRVFDKMGHNMPQERPREWTQAVLDARELAK